MTARAKRVLAVLAEANGRWVDAETIAEKLGIGRPQVSAGITEARDWLGAEIETHKVRGVGWRLRGAPPVTVEPPPPPRPKAPAGTTQLSARATVMLGLLEAAAGDYVNGRTLAAAMDAAMDQLCVYAREIRRRRPDLRVEGKQGRGYRIGALATTAGLPPVPQRQADPHRAHRTAIDLLAQLLPATAEKLRAVALEAGETVDQALYRLLEYGIEVHRDLIAAGEHPLQLRRAA